jgi:hypothetical protein
MEMKPETLLPAVVFGLTKKGYDIIGKSDDISPEDINAFLHFAKAVSWRPAKLKEKDIQGTALVPCPGGLFACRISETSPDTYGRQMTMLIEGILCPAQKAAWEPWLSPANWPSRTIQSPYHLNETPEGKTESPQIPENWDPGSNHPLVMISSHLINMPETWHVLKQEKPSSKSTFSKTIATKNSKTSIKDRSAMNHSTKKSTPNWKSLVAGLCTGIIVTVIAEYLTIHLSNKNKVHRLQAENRQWQNVTQQMLSVNTPEEFKIRLESLVLENSKLKKENQAWTRSAKSAGGVSTPQTLYTRIENYKAEIDKLRKGVSPEDQRIISKAAQFEPLIQKLGEIFEEWQLINID